MQASCKSSQNYNKNRKNSREIIKDYFKAHCKSYNMNNMLEHIGNGYVEKTLQGNTIVDNPKIHTQLRREKYLQK